MSTRAAIQILLALAILLSSVASGSEALDRLGALLAEDPESARQQAAQLMETALAEGDATTAGHAAAIVARAQFSGGQPEQAVATYEQSVDLLLQQSDAEAAISVLGELSRLRYRQGQYAEAIEVERQILALARKHDLQARRAHALSNLGVLHKRTGELPAALDFYRQALVIRREIGDRLGESQSLNNIGIMYKNWGDFFQALRYQLQALSIKRDVGEPDDVAQTLGNMALIYRELNDHEQALAYQTEAMELLAESDRPGHVIHAQANIAYTYIMLDRLDEAEPYLSSAIEGAREHQLVPHLANSLKSRAWLELKRNKLEEATATLDEIQPLSDQMGDPNFATDLLLERAEIQRRSGDLEAGIQVLEQARSLAAQHGNQSQLKRALALLGALNYELGLDKEAYALLERSVAIEKDLNSGVSARRLANQHARMLKQQNDAELALLSRDNEIAALQLARQRYFLTALLLGLALTLLVVWLLLSRNRIQKRGRDMLEQRNARIREQNVELEEKAKALFTAATVDSLTGVANRQYAIEQAEERLAACIEQDRRLSVLMIDMDHFKAINDNFSHMGGDAVLRFAASSMAAFFGPDAIVGRFGGEEFIVVLADHSLAQARERAEALRAHLESNKVDFRSDSVGTTVSIGICDRDTCQSDDLMKLIHDADQALYVAKRKGRNQVRTSMRAA